MKINEIVLFNFGSYEGENIIKIPNNTDKNIVLIGGKNGTGKTTLFTAIRLCLYGFMSFGYKNHNSFYSKAIIKLVNNTAKLSKPVKSYVKLSFDIKNGRYLHHYILIRSWLLSESLFESLEVIKDGTKLSEDETHDFEKYLLSLIPPELFNLYFFDGEKIADYFMDEGSNIRIKDAFLTLCGYDTFDIMRKNFKRTISNNGTNNIFLSDYIERRDELDNAKHVLLELQQQLLINSAELDSVKSTLESLDRDYKKRGGITQEEWDKKIVALKDEEHNRENWNGLLKKWANDIIPFLMIKDQIIDLEKQIISESSSLKYKDFCEVVDTGEILKLIPDVEKVKKTAWSLFGSDTDNILGLSLEQNALLKMQIKEIKEFDNAEVEKYKKKIQRSIKKSSIIRKELEASSIAHVQDYLTEKSSLLQRINDILTEKTQLEAKIANQQRVVVDCDTAFKKAQVLVEERLKNASINDISARAIVMLDKLQATLYEKQINRVVEFFKSEITTLMRKTHFIDSMSIDEDFNIRIFKTETISIEKMREVVKSNSIEQLKNIFGKKAIDLLSLASVENNKESIVTYFDSIQHDISLPIEIDKTSLSNGEKQIFIMALYHSLIQLCNYEIPFIIDTPFARIDTEHRDNIAKYFFRRLKGQVFILSTNEEINTRHMVLMKDKIMTTYMLENVDNAKTVISENIYFEETL